MTDKHEDWRQIGGDMNPGAYGAIIARWDGDSIEIREIQPVREYVGDGEALEVGYPYWSREGWFDPDDLDPESEDVLSALDSCGPDLADIDPEHWPMVIAECLLQYGYGDEGPSGWAADVVPESVTWWASDAPAGPEFFSDEDGDFRREVLGEPDEDEDPGYPKAYSAHGASMGRISHDESDGEHLELYVRAVPLDAGGYDPGGAYWGASEPLWRAHDANGVVDVFYRAPSRQAARTEARKRWPGCHLHGMD